MSDVTADGIPPPPRGLFQRHSLRRGRRQILFLPMAVLKLATTPEEQQLSRREAAGNAGARRHPFWRGLLVRVARIPQVGLATRRCRPAESVGDLRLISATMEARLAAAATFRAAPALGGLMRRNALDLLCPDLRAQLVTRLAGLRLPRTSMHGDLHASNFVRVGAGVRIIDWEHFDPRGSFVHDYLDFHLDRQRATSGRDWPAFLAGLRPCHPLLARVGARVGAAPAPLHAHYVLMRAAIMQSRPIPGSLPGEEAARRRILAQAVRTALSAG